MIVHSLALSRVPDRSAETWAAWLRHEPQIRLVARDRSNEYARGTTLGAPAAVQVANRWHLLREPQDLDAEAAAAVARVLQDDKAAKVADLGRRFCRIVRSRCSGAPAAPGIAPAFDAWLSEARACGVWVVESFASSLAQDGASVRAGRRLPWSSGQAEGQVNRLKLLKRAMYGRAKLDLLRRRFLLAA